MAFKPRTAEQKGNQGVITPEKLKALLRQTDLASKKTAEQATLFQFLDTFTDWAKRIISDVGNKITLEEAKELIVTPSSEPITDATYATVNNETATLPNSSQLIAGSGIVFTPTAGQLEISAPGAAGGITELTQDVLAGPGSGSQVATVPALAAEVLTGQDETALFPNSRELLAGTNITFDDSVPNERTINASGGSGITQLTGDGTAGPGSGSQALTIPALAAAVLTDGDETAFFPNSRELLAGTNVTFDDTTPNERTINVSGAPSAPPIKLSFTIDAGGTAITATGLQKYFSFPCNGTIVAVRILADVAGDAVFDIWADDWASRPPTNADSIIGGGTKPELTTDQFYEDTTFSGWTTTTVNEGDLGGIELESSATVTWLILEIFIQPS